MPPRSARYCAECWRRPRGDGRLATSAAICAGNGPVPSNEKRDGNERRIVVQVPSREGIEVSREIGYVGSLR